MSDWRRTRLGDFAPFSYGKALPERLRVAGNIPVYGSNGIVGQHNERLIDGPMVVIGRKGSVGEVHFAPHGGWPIDTTFYVTTGPQRDARFTYYLLKYLDMRHMSSDSAVPGLNRDAAHRRELLLPPLSEQRAIAEVLGALDDKIEANNTLIRAIAKVTSSLFHATFELRRATASVPLSSIAEVIDCLHSKKPSRSDSQFRYLVLADVRDDGRLAARPNYTIGESDYAAWTRRVEVRGGDCVITNVGRVGAAAQLATGMQAAVGRNMTAIRPRNRLYTAFLIEALRSQSLAREIEANTDHGTILSALNVRSIPHLNLPGASREELEVFHRRCAPLHDLQDALLAEGELLSGMRDALLPKLMSGELRARAAEGVGEEAV